MKRFKNQHEWGVIAQVFDPYYQEFQFCPLCNKYKANGELGYIKRVDIPLNAFLADTYSREDPGRGIPYWTDPRSSGDMRRTSLKGAHGEPSNS